MNEYLSWCIFGVATVVAIAALCIVGMRSSNEQTLAALSKGCSVVGNQFICPGLTK